MRNTIFSYSPVLFACVAWMGCSSASNPATNEPDAGSHDSGSRDGAGGQEAGASNDTFCNPTYVFCDGFEDGLKNWSQIYASGGVPKADTTHVYKGKYALLAHVDSIAAPAGKSGQTGDGGAGGTRAYAYVQQVQTLPMHSFTRLFLWQPSPHAGSKAAVLDLLGTYSPYPGIELLTDPPKGALSMKTYATNDNQVWGSTEAISEDNWVCLELEVDVEAQTSRLYMNDQEVTDLSQSHLSLPALGILGVGLSFYLPEAQGPEDVWIDEVAVDTARIGCPK